MTDIFVFGSNLAGRHGKGAALYALKHYGARYGDGEGLTGNSYAIPTKDANLVTLALSEINNNVNRFLRFATHRPDLNFILTPVGCGLAGYKREQIRPMFAAAESMANVHFHAEWGISEPKEGA